MATTGIPHFESHPEYQYVFWCTVCHVQVVATGEAAKQIVQAIEEATDICSEKEIAALHTCESCSKALCNG